MPAVYVLLLLLLLTGYCYVWLTELAKTVRRGWIGRKGTASRMGTERENAKIIPSAISVPSVTLADTKQAVGTFL